MSCTKMPESNILNQVLDIVAYEVGVDYDELSDDAEFADLGVDTILARQIAQKVLATTRVAINATIFTQAENIGDFKKQISQSLQPQRPKAETKKSLTTTPLEIPQQPICVRLQGNASAPRKLFLLPDGSGSAMAYAQIPRLGARFVIYGLNSPLLHRGPCFSGSIEDLAAKWVVEIRRVQPKGPYMLGGWSAGGYHTFEVAKRLIQQHGESVEKLVLIDSPCCLVFEALPMHVVRYLAAHNLMGNWGGKQTPQWLVDHFEATITAVEKYRPTPMDFPLDKMPEVFVIWARDGLLPSEGSLQAHPELKMEAKVTRFLLQKRPNFGPHGWDALFPGKQLAIATMPGHHFAVIYKPNVIQLGTLLLDVVGSERAGKSERWNVIVPR